MSSDLPHDNIILCECIDTGCVGKLSINDMYIEFHSINKPLEDTYKKVIKLRTQKGDFATLIDCQIGRSARLHGSAFWVYSRRMYANYIVIGPECWVEDYTVCSVHFSFTDAKTALYYREHISRDNKYGIDSDKLRILDFSTSEGINLQIVMDVTIECDYQNIVESSPKVDLLFDHPILLKDIFEFLYVINSFFELSLGKRCRIYDVRVIRNNGPYHTLIDGSLTDQPHHFEVKCLNTNSPKPETRISIGNVLFPVWEKCFRQSTKTLLKNWIDRRDEWSEAYQRMSGYFATNGQYGRDEIMRLAAWFEAIPFNMPKGSRLTKQQRKSLVSLLKRETRVLGYELEDSKIQNTISRLFESPLRERVHYAVNKVINRFGILLKVESFEKDCHLFFDFRNNVAHRRAAYQESEWHMFERSVEAVKMLCALSMLDELDFSPVRVSEAKYHPLLCYNSFEDSDQLSSM